MAESPSQPGVERPSASSRLLSVASAVLLWVGVPLLALGLRIYFSHHLDLRDFPGPASGHIMTLAGSGGEGGPAGGMGVDSHLLWAVNVLGGDPLVAMRRIMMTLGLVGVLGAMLGGWAVAGRLGALAAGLLAAGWSQSLMLALMVSYDTAGYAAGWLGLGLALAAAAWAGSGAGSRAGAGAGGASASPSLSGRALGVLRELAWMAGLGLGGLLVVYALGAKEVAHPLLPMLAAAPLFVRRGWWRRGIAAAEVGVIGVWGLSWLLRLGLVNPRSPRHIRRLPDVDPQAVPDGLRRVWDLLYVGPGPAANLLLYLTVGAVVGALVPGRSWLGRLGLGAVSAVALGLSYDLIGDWLRLRYLAVPSLPILLLAAALLAGVGAVLGRLWRPLAVIPAAAVFALTVVDAVDYARVWSTYREAFTEVTPSTLPVPPPWPWHRNDREVGTAFGDFTIEGGIGMLEIVEHAPVYGVATLPSRDSRESHITAAAELRGLPWTIMDTRNCCAGDRGTDTCAAQVVAAIDDAGAVLILPRMIPGDPRQSMPHLEGWRRLVTEAAEARGELVPATRFWYTFTGKGSSGVLPCQAGRRAAPRP